MQDLGVDCTYRDITKENPTEEEITSWVNRGVPLAKLFNSSGQLYRQMNGKERRKTDSQEQLIAWLASDGMLVKRPIVISDDQIIVGNKLSEYKSLLK